MATAAAPDWINAPAKWAAVVALGAASVFGMAWSITMRGPLAAPAPTHIDPAPPVDPPSQPGRVILREDSPADAAPPPTKPRPGTPAPTARLNLNTASAAELELLPGIGPALAARIVEDRAANGPFRSVDDLDRVKGIGPKTLGRIRALCTVE